MSTTDGPPTPDRMPTPATNRQALDVGDPAPDFTLRRTFEESVTLSEWNARSAILLLFYVFDFGRV
ncbi:MAG: hypothetical protein OEM22_02600 [Acidimicrobiia bacterium]|nr:hypothetical protein [Acidimicrobiia bacterium]MDH3470930.1 hypothetical protein [Acidimicrobiia bacterium]